MPVELTIVETELELGQTVAQVILESASEPGPAGAAGVGVPAGGTADQVLTKQSGTDFDTAWEDVAAAIDAAPTDGTYLVTTAHGDLDAEVVVGATPGGELGGTWASPTVDATHSGSSHADVQAAAEATAATALNAHVTDASDAHDASAISVDSTNLSGTGTTVQASLEELDNLLDDHSARHENGGADEISIAGLDGVSTELAAHLADASDAHDASAISVVSTTLSGTGTDVQAVFEEIDNLLDDHSARHENGGADEINIGGLDGTPTELTNHLNDAADAHDASAISVADAGAFYTATDVEGVLAEIAPQLGGGSGESMQRDIAQTGHGLAVKDVVRYNGTAFVKAQADSAANSEVVGMVAAVADADNFTLHYGGRITGLSGLTAGSAYFLDDDTAGLLTATEPADLGDISKPLLIADSTTSGYFYNYRGAEVVTTIADHIADAADAHDASAVSVLDSGANYTATDVEGVLAEIAPQLGGGGLFDAYALLRDEKASGTDGGNASAATWHTRTLNTEVDPDGIVSIASNQFTLQAGTYWISARAPGGGVNRQKAKIYNVTDAADALVGASAYAISTAYTVNDATVRGRITIAGAKAFELRHYCQTAATDGLGTSSDIASTIEVYAEVEIWREA